MSPVLLSLNIYEHQANTVATSCSQRRLCAGMLSKTRRSVAVRSLSRATGKTCRSVSSVRPPAVNSAYAECRDLHIRELAAASIAFQHSQFRGFASIARSFSSSLSAILFLNLNAQPRPPPMHHHILLLAGSLTLTRFSLRTGTSVNVQYRLPRDYMYPACAQGLQPNVVVFAEEKLHVVSFALRGSSVSRLWRSTAR